MNRCILVLYISLTFYSQKKVSRIMATSEKVATIIKFVTVKSLINQCIPSNPFLHVK